jgi:hypothetical protein
MRLFQPQPIAPPVVDVKPRIVKIGFGRTVPGPQSYSSVRFDAEVECAVDPDGRPEAIADIRAKLISFVDASLSIAQRPPEERIGTAQPLYPVGKEG